MTAFCRKHEISLTEADIQTRGCTDRKKQRGKASCYYFMQAIDWPTMTASEVRQNGHALGEIRTDRSVYENYRYRGYIVQLDKESGEITIVIRGNEIVWMSPVTQRGLERLRER